MKNERKVLMQEGDLLSKFPELEELKGFSENNRWHENDNVYDHTMKVYEKLRLLLSFDFISDSGQREQLKKYFAGKIGSVSRREILLLSGLFHDIAKPDVFQTSENGETSCPNHDISGSEKTKEILKNHHVNENVISRVCSIVKNHHKIIPLTSPSIDPKSMEIGIKQTTSEIGDIFPEIVVLGFADTQASQLEIKNNEEYEFRMSQYKIILNSLNFNSKLGH